MLPSHGGPSALATLASAAMGSYYGMLIGDALAAPVHWFYSPRDIDARYGTLSAFVPVPEDHPGSIMSLSATGGGGRGSQGGDVIGRIINHGKKQYWQQRGVHYHRGLRAGENTLNAQCAREVVRGITADGGTVELSHLLENYVRFMTTPGSHNDTYADTSHRDFFANYARGVPPAQCAANDGHNTDSTGGLCGVAPVALATMAAELRRGGEPGAAATYDAVRQSSARYLALTHRSTVMEGVASNWGELVARAALAQPPGSLTLRPLVAAAAKRAGVADLASLMARYPGGLEDDRRAIGSGGAWSSACYISDSFPALLFLAYKYADDPVAAIIANTNVGGDNVGRGAALGALLGAHYGVGAWGESWTSGLYPAAEVAAEGRAFAQALLTGAGAAKEL